MNLSWSNQPAFVAYAIASLILALNLLFLWNYSGAVRGKTKTTLNEEDARQFGTTLVPTDPPQVARVVRAYANAEAATVPFLVLGLVYVLAGGGGTSATIIFSVFTLARVLHTVAYLKALQPWRSALYTLALLAQVALMIAIVWRLFQAA